jgi:hypothetical protein
LRGKNSRISNTVKDYRQNVNGKYGIAIAKKERAIGNGLILLSD